MSQSKETAGRGRRGEDATSRRRAQAQDHHGAARDRGNTPPSKGHTRPDSTLRRRKDVVLPPIQMSHVAVPAIPLSSVSSAATPRVTAALSFKDVLTARHRVVTARGASMAMEMAMEMPQSRSTQSQSQSGQSQSQTQPGQSPSPLAPRAMPAVATGGGGWDRVGWDPQTKARSEELSRLANKGDDPASLLERERELAAAVQTCAVLGCPRVILDMLEMHQRHLSTGYPGHRNPGPSKGNPPRVAAGVDTPDAILRRIKDRLSLCDELLTTKVA